MCHTFCALVLKNAARLNAPAPGRQIFLLKDSFCSSFKVFLLGLRYLPFAENMCASLERHERGGQGLALISELGPGKSGVIQIYIYLCREVGKKEV